MSNIVENIIENVRYGDKTAKKLEEYERAHPFNPDEQWKWQILSLWDLIKNKHEMERLGLQGGDKYFHCRGNYEAASRGWINAVLAYIAGNVRELRQTMTEHQTIDLLMDTATDINANNRGLAGALLGKTLQESCPYHPLDYNDLSNPFNR